MTKKSNLQKNLLTLTQKDFYRLELATPHLLSGNFAKNCDTLCACITQAQKNGTDILVLPKKALSGVDCLAMTGYAFSKSPLIESMKRILETSKNCDALLVIPFAWVHCNQILDIAWIVHQGHTLTLASNAPLPLDLPLHDFTLAPGLDFSNQVVSIDNNCHLLINFCDDHTDLLASLSKKSLQGVHLVLHLSSAVSLSDSVPQAIDTLKVLSKQTNTAQAYIANHPLDSAYGTVCSGDKIIVECGELLKASTLDSGSLFADIDIAFVRHAKQHKTTQVLHNSNACLTPVSQNTPQKLDRIFDPHPFVAPATSNEHILDSLVLGVYAKMQELHTPKVILGLSGGLDSTMVLLVCQRLFDKYNLPSKNLIAVSMSGFGTGGRSEKNAHTLANALDTTHLQISIVDAVTHHLKDIDHNGQPDTTYENAQARERTQILLDLANKHGALLLGTGDLSEIALGWSTYGGDQLAQYNPNSGLTKSQIRALVAYIAKNHTNSLVSQTLNDILDAPITPELIAGQDTEQLIGPYALHDFFLYHFLYRGGTPTKIFGLATTTFANHKKEDIKKHLKLFFTRFFANQFKRKYGCDGIRLFEIDLLSNLHLNANFDPSTLLLELDKI
ncbi:MAG: NAD(+) synthase [Firmicutes bacterium]|nr:NAD(+) synthase [Bacillota bacterium]